MFLNELLSVDDAVLFADLVEQLQRKVTVVKRNNITSWVEDEMYGEVLEIVSSYWHRDSHFNKVVSLQVDVKWSWVWAWGLQATPFLDLKGLAWISRNFKLSYGSQFNHFV